jgi:hypothetical protein
MHHCSGSTDIIHLHIVLPAGEIGLLKDRHYCTIRPHSQHPRQTVYMFVRNELGWPMGKFHGKAR